MARSLDASLSMLELAVKHGSPRAAARIVEYADDFVEGATKFAAARGIDASALDVLSVRLLELNIALRVGNSRRIKNSRREALAALVAIRSETVLLSSERYEAQMPPWLTL